MKVPNSSLAVQVVGVAVNYDAYILESGAPNSAGAQQRYFSPLRSPLLAEASELGQQLSSRFAQLQPGHYTFGPSV